MSFSKTSMVWQKIKARITLANAYQTLTTMTTSNPHCTLGGIFFCAQLLCKDRARPPRFGLAAPFKSRMLASFTYMKCEALNKYVNCILYYDFAIASDPHQPILGYELHWLRINQRVGTQVVCCVVTLCKQPT